MKIPKNMPRFIYGGAAQKRKYKSKEREVTVSRKYPLPEEVDVALQLYADDLAKVVGTSSLDSRTPLLDLLYRSKVFREYLTKAREAIKIKRGTSSDETTGGSNEG